MEKDKEKELEQQKISFALQELQKILKTLQNKRILLNVMIAESKDNENRLRGKLSGINLAMTEITYVSKDLEEKLNK